MKSSAVRKVESPPLKMVNNNIQEKAVHIQLQQVGKVYHSAGGDLTALSGVDLTIKDGEFFSLLGPSGCGKSTVLRCLAGLEDITSGTIQVDGKPVSGPPDGLGVVFQRDILLDWRNILDNVMLPFEFKASTRKGELRDKAMELLSMVGLEGYAKRYPWELSGGMRQRVAICRALITEPTLLLMDEPFGALDEFTRDKLNLDLLDIWTKRKTSIVFITHSISESILLSDRVAVMGRNPGRIMEIVDIDLARPRDITMRDTHEFIELSAHIRKIFDQMGSE